MMENQHSDKPKQEAAPAERSEADKKMDPRDVAESKRIEWEKQNKARD